MWIFPSVHIFSKTHCKETEISTKRECAYLNVSVKFSGECSWEIVWKSYIVSISVELERTISTCDVNSPLIIRPLFDVHIALPKKYYD